MNSSAWIRAERRLGTVLRQRWTLDRVIGLGGTAAVYAATHRNGSRVAIKVLHSSLDEDPAVRLRFLREGYLANQVRVPDVVKVIDDDVDGEVAYLVMELLEGESLESLRERAGGRLGPADVVEIACRLLRVLEAAHSRGILHRDVKPANLFRTVDPVGFKVLDFGIARTMAAPASSAGTLPGSEGRVGTPAFMAPEQARGERGRLDERTDLWAVGATLFTMLTGQHVHSARTTTEMLHSAAERAAPPVRDHVPGIPEELAAIVDRALAFDPTARFESACEMRIACDDCRRSLAARGERSRFFSSASRWPNAPSAARAATAVVRPKGASATVHSANLEPRAGFWSGRVGRLWWFYYTGPCTQAMWDYYLDMVRRMIDGDREATLACLAHCADAPSPLQRRQMADFIAANQAALARLDRFALVIDSIAHRGAITALSWLVRKPFDERIFNSPIAAIKWLTEPHSELDADAVRASIASQVPHESLWISLRSAALETLAGRNSLPLS